MGTGHRLWAAVGGDGRWPLFGCVHSRFWVVILVFGQSFLIVVRWGRHGGSADIGSGHRVCLWPRCHWCGGGGG
jgi:hypothetical protein